MLLHHAQDAAEPRTPTGTMRSDPVLHSKSLTLEANFRRGRREREGERKRERTREEGKKEKKVRKSEGGKGNVVPKENPV